MVARPSISDLRPRTAPGFGGRFSVCLVLFVVGSAVGFLVDPVGSASATASGRSLPLSGVAGIFLNNAFVAAVLVLGGVLFGGPTILTVLYNGIIVGSLFGRLTAPEQVLLLVPHGVLEIPALVLAAAVGLRFPQSFVAYLRGNRETAFSQADAEEVVSVSVRVFGLLLVAAAVESWFTVTVYQQFA